MKNKKALLAIIICFGLILTVGFAEAKSLMDAIPCAKTGGENCGPCDFIQMFVNGSDIIMGLAGAFSVLMFIFGGFLMITAYGNESRYKWGKDAIIATVTGILIVLLAWTLINSIILALYGGTDGVLPRAYENITGQNASWGVCSYPTE